MEKKKSKRNKLIIITSSIFAFLLIAVIVVLIPIKANDHKKNPPVKYKYDVILNSYDVTIKDSGEEKVFTFRDAYFYSDEQIEDAPASPSNLRSTLAKNKYFLLEYIIVNRSTETTVNASIDLTNIVSVNCEIKHAVGDGAFVSVDSDTIELVVAPETQAKYQIKIAVENYALNASCTGELSAVLSVA